METKDYILNIPDGERRFAAHGVTVQKRSSDAADAEPKEYVMRGYAALFNVEADLGYAKEVIMPGAFDECMANDVRCLQDHLSHMVLGRGNNKPAAFGNGQTMRFGVDSTGLWYECILDPEITFHSDLIRSIGRNDINQSSFGFIVKEQSWIQTDQGKPNIRRILKVRELFDLSPVTYPAYEDTTVGMRSLTRFKSESIGADEAAQIEEMRNTLHQVEVSTSNLMLGVIN